MKKSTRGNTSAVKAFLGVSSYLALATSAALSNPVDPKIIAGDVSVQGLGSANVVIGNNSLRSIVDWGQFSIGSGETTAINQINANAAILNRVTGENPSEIYGHLTSNGQVYLINQHGILVGPSGVVDTNGFVASTLDVSNTDFLGAGEMIFKQGVDAGGGIKIEGTVRSITGGDIFLLSREIEIGEQGKISSKGGYVGLGAGEEILLKPTDSGDGRISIRAGKGRITNRGLVEGVAAELRAAGGNEYALAINNTGVVRATGYSKNGGRVLLTGGGTVSNTGHIHATQKIIIRSTKRIENSGTVQASNAATGKGGTVVLDAPEIAIGSTSFIDVSGALGGGRAFIGGGNQGGTALGADGEVVVLTNAKNVTVDSAAIINASATQSGDAGNVVVWSDGSTTFAGDIIATAAAGKGGDAEVSGKQTLIYNGFADLRGAAGVGTLLLDPGQVNINHGSGTNTVNTFFDINVQSSLATASVTITTNAANNTDSDKHGATEDIVIGAGVRIVWSAPSGANTALTLNAGHDITALDNVIIQNSGFASTPVKNQGGVVFEAGNDIKIGSASSRTGAVAIGSQYGQTLIVAGNPGFSGFPTLGTGNVSVIGGDTVGSSAQIGYVGSAPLSGTILAGDISVYAGGDVTLTSGRYDDRIFQAPSSAAAFAQIGDGGAAAVPGGNIDGSNITVYAKTGSVKLDSATGIEQSYAQIGHGYSVVQNSSSTISTGNLIGNITVGAGTSVLLNDTVDTNPVPNSDGQKTYIAAIGNGSHIDIQSATGGTINTGIKSGTVTVGGSTAIGGSALASLTLGSSIAPISNADMTQVFSQVGHGDFVRLDAGQTNGSYPVGGDYVVNLGAMIAATVGTTGFGVDISALANAITINSIENAPLNDGAGFTTNTRNLERGQIGSGNVVRGQQTDGRAAAHADNMIVTEGEISGNITVKTNADTGSGISLNSQIVGGSTAINGDILIARIGHGSFMQLEALSGYYGVNGGSVSYTQANVLQSSIVVQTQNNDSISLTSSVTAGSAPVTSNNLLSTIGSGGEAFLTAGQGGEGGDVKFGHAAGNGGDIIFAKGTVWDGIDPSEAQQSPYTAYDTSIQIISAKDINVVSTETASSAQIKKNASLARVGHGDFIQLVTLSGGASNFLYGTNGGRGGDVVVVQQTPDRDYGDTGAKDDQAWGLRGTISLQASDANATAITVHSAVNAVGSNTAENISSTAQVGHGDFMSVVTGAGGAGGSPNNVGSAVYNVTAWGGRGGNADIDLSNMLIESDIVSSDNNAVHTNDGVAGTLANGTGIIGAVLVDAQTTNATSPSQHNWSDASIGHGEAVSVLSGNGGAGGADWPTLATGGTYLTNGVTVQQSETDMDAFMEGASLASNRGASVAYTAGLAGEGATRGGNGGDVQVLLGTVTDRTGDATSGLHHDGKSNVLLNLQKTDANGVSLTVNAQINTGLSDGNGDDVNASVGARSKVLAVGGTGGDGGAGAATLDPYLGTSVTLAQAAVPIQNDASGGRGGDVVIAEGSGVSPNAFDSLNRQEYLRQAAKNGAVAFANPAPSGADVIGDIIIKADGQVKVTANNLMGGYAETNATIGKVFDLVAVTQNGGSGGTLYGNSGVTDQSSSNDGIVDSKIDVQIVNNYDGTQGVSLLKNGNSDSISSVAALRSNTDASVPSAVKNAMFYDTNGNPEFILDGSNQLVKNNVANNLAFGNQSQNTALFGRVVGTAQFYDTNSGGGDYVANYQNYAQYVELGVGTAGHALINGATGRPDLVAAVAGGALTVVDLNHDGKYDQISGRVRLADGTSNNLGTFGLMDETIVTGYTPTVSGGVSNAASSLSWTNPTLVNGALSTANFSTSDGGRGGNAATHLGWTKGDIVVQAELAGPVSGKTDDFSIKIDSNVIGSAKPGSPGHDVGQARIGDYAYQISDTGGYSSNRLNGSTFNVGGSPLVSSAANGGNAGGNAVNGLGGAGGTATLEQGASRLLNPSAVQTAWMWENDFFVGNIYLNANADGTSLAPVPSGETTVPYKGAGVEVSSLDDNDKNYNVSVAQVGHGAFAVAGSGDQGANAGNAPAKAGANGGTGESDSGSNMESDITVYANGGAGGSSMLMQDQIKGNVTVYAGGNAKGDFAVSVSAIKGAGISPGDSNDTVLAQIGSGRLATAGAGDGGTIATGGAYQANGGNGGNATLNQLALLDGNILVDADRYAAQNKGDGKGHGVTIDSEVQQGANHIVRGQIGAGDIAFALSGAGGSLTTKFNFTHNINETANGGNGGNASITQGDGTNYIDVGINVVAAQAKTGKNAVLVKSANLTQYVKGQHHLLADIGDGSLGFAQSAAGGNGGQDASFGTGPEITSAQADPQFYQGVDVAASEPANLASGAVPTSNLDTNSLNLGTIRNGGKGGNATVKSGNIGWAADRTGLDSGVSNVQDREDINVTANTYTGTQNGIKLDVTTGIGDTTTRLVDANVAMIGHAQFDRADATPATGGNGPQDSYTSAVISEGNGGNGGDGSTTIGRIAGNINVVNTNVSNSAQSGDGDIALSVANNGLDNNVNEQGQALIGSRSFGEAYGGAGGRSAIPGAGPNQYQGSISEQGGNGGGASVNEAAVLGDISVSADGSIIVNVAASKAISTLVGQIGHDMNAEAVAGAGGVGGDTASFNGYAIWNALARYYSFGNNAAAFAKLSAYDQLLAGPIVNNYFGGTLPASFVSQILSGYKAAGVLDGNGNPSNLGLGRDDYYVGTSASHGTNYTVPALSADELKTLQAISAAAGRGGNATITQGSILTPYTNSPSYQIGTSGSITLLANALGNQNSTVKGIDVIASGSLASGAEIARIGHEMEIKQATGGVGPDVRDYSTGIGGNGGNVNVTQYDIKAVPSSASTNFYGQDVLLETADTLDGSYDQALADIYVSSSTSTGTDYARAYVGNRQVIGDDVPQYRSAAVLQAGNGGSDSKTNNEGYLGNGGSVTSTQGGVVGDVSLVTTGKTGGNPNIQVLATQSKSTTEALTMIGSQVLLDSAKGGDAGFYTAPHRYIDGLYGVALADGGAVTITQGDFTATGNGVAIASTESLLANWDVLVKTSTSAASGKANLLIGNDQVVGDTRWGKGSGTIKSGNGGNTLVEDVAPATGALDSGLANGAPGQTDGVHATPVADANGGDVNILLGTEGIGITTADATLGAVVNIVSTTGTIGDSGLTTGILSSADTGPATTYLGQLRTVTASTGEGGVQGGTLLRTPGQGGTATLERGAVMGDVDVTTQASSNTEVRVDATESKGAAAKTLLGHTVDYSITTGRSGYGLDVYAATNLVGTYSANGVKSVIDSLQKSQTDFASMLAPLSTPIGTTPATSPATYRDVTNAIHDLENVVAVLSAANRNAARYSTADATKLNTALATAQNALNAANAALTAYNTGSTAATGNLATLVSSVKAATGSSALGALAAAATLNYHATQLSAQADGGNINYTNSLLWSGTNSTPMANEGLVSGNMTLSAGKTVNNGVPTYGTGVVAVTAEGGLDADALTELGHRYTITDTTGIGGGLNESTNHDGGVAGNGGSITVTQTTVGDTTLNADTVVIHSLSGTAAADVHLLANVAMTNTAAEADITDNLGQGGDISATQATTGSAIVNANYVSSSDGSIGKTSADRIISAAGGSGASHVRVGIEATTNNYSNSDLTPTDTPRTSDINRGGLVSVAQTIQADASGKTFLLNLNLAGDNHASDLEILATAVTSDVNIGNIGSETAISGTVSGGTTAANNGWDVTASQSVTGDISIPKVEDLLIGNTGAGAAGIHIGQSAYQDAESGFIDPTNLYYGGVVTASQTATGAIGISATRSATIQSGGSATDTLQIGHNVKQIAKAADRRPGTIYPVYPAASVVTTAPTGIVLAPSASGNTLNLMATQTTGGDLSLTASEIMIENQDAIGIKTPTSGYLGYAQVAGVEFGHAAQRIVDTRDQAIAGGMASSVSDITGTINLKTIAPIANADTKLPLGATDNGDITVDVTKASGKVQVGDTSISTVSHAGPPAPGDFYTVQAIGDYTLTSAGRVVNTATNAINITAYRNLSVTTAAAGTSQIGHYITERGGFDNTPDNLRLPSLVQQTVGSDINVNVGNNLLVKTVGGTAEIGHIAPEGDQWQVTGGTVVTPQLLDGNITVEVGTDKKGTINGNASGGGDDALLDGSAGGEVRIGHDMADVPNQTSVAAGDIWVRVMADLEVNTAAIGHGDYDFTSVPGATGTSTTVPGGTTRNRIIGNTTIGAGQLTPARDQTTLANVMKFIKAMINSGYGGGVGAPSKDVNGQLRFFIPSRKNLTTDTASVFNDSSAYAADAVPARTNEDNHVTGDIFQHNTPVATQNHENGFLPMSKTAAYTNIGAGNFAFYFDEPQKSAPYQPNINWFDMDQGVSITWQSNGQGDPQGSVNSGTLDNPDYIGTSSNQENCLQQGGTLNADGSCDTNTMTYQFQRNGFGSSGDFGGQSGGNSGGELPPVGDDGGPGTFNSTQAMLAPVIIQPTTYQMAAAPAPSYTTSVTETFTASVGLGDSLRAGGASGSSLHPLESIGVPVVVVYQPSSNVEINQIRKIYPNVLAYASTFGIDREGM